MTGNRKGDFEGDASANAFCDFTVHICIKGLFGGGTILTKEEERDERPLGRQPGGRS